MSSDVVMKIEGLWKRYGLPIPDVLGKFRSFLGSSNSAERNGESRNWALRDVNLEVRRGETMKLWGSRDPSSGVLLEPSRLSQASAGTNERGGPESLTLHLAEA
jgi:lipopolysaccharide transport system ATP-binding protein